MYSDWFPHETELVFLHDGVCKDGPRNFATFKMELFAKIGDDRVYDQWTEVFVSCCSNSTIFTGKLKSDENSHALKVAPD